MPASSPSVAQARVCLVLAAVVWSLGSLFIRLLREPTPLALHEPELTPLQIAFFRASFAGLIMLPLLKRDELKLRASMIVMAGTFALMSALYLTALSYGAAANAIFLQNTAPLWVCVMSVLFMGERVSRRDWQGVLLGALGAAVIVVGGWPRGLPPDEQARAGLVLLMGLGSGVVYAGVVLFLRSLREYSPAWLVFLNHLGSALTIGAFVLLTTGFTAWVGWVSVPTYRQLAVLAIFGAVQMALPYWLFARGLRTVGPQEAGIITLIEPLLNPIWAYLITPEKDTPTLPMFVGGALILSALLWRYFPEPRQTPTPEPTTNHQSHPGTNPDSAPTF